MLDSVWADLADLGFVKDAELTGDSTELIRWARKLSAGRGPAPRSGRHDLPPVAAGGTSVVTRARALSELVADEAAGDPSVARYRRRFLGGHPIAFAAVERLLASPAAGLVPAVAWAGARVPLIAYDSRIVRETRAGCRGRWPDCNRVRIEFEVRSADDEWLAVTEDSPSRRRFLSYQSGDRPELVVAVANDSPLEHLLNLAEALGAEYRWRTSEAAAYVLEGIVPSVRPIEVATSFHVAPGGLRQATVTITVDPTVPAADVARAYRDAQGTLLPTRPRVPGKRTMAAVTFVSQRRRENPATSWRELMLAFNRHHAPTFRSVPAFIQAVQRGRLALGRGVKLTPHLEYWLPRLERRQRSDEA